MERMVLHGYMKQYFKRLLIAILEVAAFACGVALLLAFINLVGPDVGAPVLAVVLIVVVLLIPLARR